VRTLAIGLALVALGVASCVAARAEPARGAGAGLLARLNAAGRAEARIERRAPDPLGGGERRASGRLALELPDRARLDFDDTRESLTLRSDGGEWLQPALHQLIRFGPESARVGLRWWSVMLGRGGIAHAERAAAGGRTLLTLAPESGSVRDSAWVTLGRDALPRELEVVEPDGGHAVYRIGRWKFLAPRGATAFVLHGPAGYEIVDMR